MGRSQWVCIVEGCKANPSKRNNIERHVWLQHARKWHYGDKPEPYSVIEHKHIVEPYIRRQRGPDGSTPSPLTPPFTPPGSPSSKNNKPRVSLTPAPALRRTDGEGTDGTATSNLAAGASGVKHEHYGGPGPIRVITPSSMHTPQPTPHGSPLTTKGGRLVTGAKSAPGSPYPRRPRREDLQQLNTTYNYQAYLAQAHRQQQSAMQQYGMHALGMYLPNPTGAPTAAPSFATPTATPALTLSYYTNPTTQAAMSAAHAAAAAQMGSAPSATTQSTANTMTANSSHAVGSGASGASTPNPASATVADMAAAAPHVPLLLADASNTFMYANAGRMLPGTLGVPTGLAPAQLSPALAQASPGSNGTTDGLHYNLPHLTLMSGMNGLDVLASACNEDLRNLGPDNEPIWRPY